MNLHECLHQIFDQYDRDITKVPKHWERTDESKAALNKAVATIASDLKGMLPKKKWHPAHKVTAPCKVCKFNDSINEMSAAIDRYCGVGEMQSKQEPKEK